MVRPSTSFSMGASGVLELPPETAVVLHDAGAANQVLAWLDAGLVPAGRVVAQGPAAALWAARSRPPLVPDLETALTGASALLSGTGWGSDLEHRARRMAKDRGLPSHAVLDHWVNYRERFTRGSETQLPDLLLVVDAEAETLASACFPGIPVSRAPNLYLTGQLDGISALEREASQPPHGLLVLMEPARSSWGRTQDGSFQALDALVAHWAGLDLPDDLPLWIRPHPSDPPHHYASWIAANPARLPQLAGDRPLAADIAAASHVAGLNSYAMTIALASGRPVLSILPPWAPPCMLPHAGIRHLRDLVGIVA